MSTQILDLIGSDVQLKHVATTNGGEYAGACPFCHAGEDRLRVWPNDANGGRWWCRVCGKSGDGVAYEVERGSLTTTEAYRLRHAGEQMDMRKITITPARAEQQLPEVCSAPNATWQERAWERVAVWQAALWSESGASALSWLHGRGLTDETIRHAGLCFNGADTYVDRELWGLPAGNKIYLPRGIGIPWFIGEDLWRLNIRRAIGSGDDGPKYLGPAGYGQGLYEADRLKPGGVALMVEGEFDAMTANQEVGDIVQAVATGSTGHGRSARWIARLSLCDAVLVCFDADEAGDAARSWWVDALPNAVPLRPFWGDVSSMFQAGVNLRQWIATAITR